MKFWKKLGLCLLAGYVAFYLGVPSISFGERSNVSGEWMSGNVSYFEIISK